MRLSTLLYSRNRSEGSATNRKNYVSIFVPVGCLGLEQMHFVVLVLTLLSGQFENAAFIWDSGETLGLTKEKVDVARRWTG